MPARDPYEVLGVPRTATAGEIRAAYLELVARYHPDQHRGHPLEDLATERLAEINIAYEALADPARRAAGDASGPRGLRVVPGEGAGAAPRWPVGRWLVWGLLGVAALLLLPRLARLLLAPLRGTPAILVLFLAAVAIAVALVWRSRRKRGPRAP